MITPINTRKQIVLDTNLTESEPAYYLDEKEKAKLLDRPDTRGYFWANGCLWRRIDNPLNADGPDIKLIDCADTYSPSSQAAVGWSRQGGGSPSYGHPRGGGGAPKTEDFVEEDGEPKKWADCDTTALDGQIGCCFENSKYMIRSAYKRLIKLPCLDKFPKELRERIHTTYKDYATIECLYRPCKIDLPYGPQAIEGRWDENKKKLYICITAINEARLATPEVMKYYDDLFVLSDIDYLTSLILHELVHAAGGGELDAVSIVRYCFPRLPDENYESFFDFWDVIMNSPIQTQFDALFYDGKNFVLYGQYVVWDPSTGTVYIRDRSASYQIGGTMFNLNVDFHVPLNTPFYSWLRSLNLPNLYP